MVIIAYRLAQGWAGPGGFTVMTGRVPPTVYFKLLWLSHPAPYLVNTQSWSCYLHPDKVCTNTSAPLHPIANSLTSTSSIPSNPVCFFFLFSKLFLYHTSISHGDQYRCNSLGLPKSACLQAFAHITAIDPSRFGPAPTFNMCAAAQQASTRSRNKLFEIKIMDLVWSKQK